MKSLLNTDDIMQHALINLEKNNDARSINAEGMK